MGRYAAPQFDIDHVDDGQPMPMDWDAISDNDDDDDQRNGSNITNEGEPQSLVCCNGNDSTTEKYNDAYDSVAYHEEQLRMAEYQYNLEQQQKQNSEKKWTRLRTLTIIAVAIIAIVLKRHAPPPPPILNQSPFATDQSPTSYSNGMASTTDEVEGGYSYQQNMIHVHETWGSYLGTACFYVWYISYNILATSNAFRYSFEEVRDTCNNVLDRFGTLKDENIWTDWKKKLETIDILGCCRSCILSKRSKVHKRWMKTNTMVRMEC